MSKHGETSRCHNSAMSVVLEGSEHQAFVADERLEHRPRLMRYMVTWARRCQEVALLCLTKSSRLSIRAEAGGLTRHAPEDERVDAAMASTCNPRRHLASTGMRTCRQAQADRPSCNGCRAAPRPDPRSGTAGTGSMRRWHAHRSEASAQGWPAGGLTSMQGSIM